jgi:hypothetical protein
VRSFHAAAAGWQVGFVRKWYLWRARDNSGDAGDGGVGEGEEREEEGAFRNECSLFPMNGARASFSCVGAWK